MDYLNLNDLLNTSDMALCATLYCYGYTIEAIDKKNPSKAIFLIKRDENLDNLIEKYWRKELLIEPIAFFNCLKEVKSRIYQD